MTVIDIDTLERIKPYLSQQVFTLEQAINSRVYRDPDHKAPFYSFLISNFAEMKKMRRDETIEETHNRVWERIKETFFDVNKPDA